MGLQAANPDGVQERLSAEDRLWFFSSGRYGKGSNQVTLAQTGIGLASVDTNKRGEIKMTGTVAQGHTIQSGYLNSPRTRTNNSGLQSFIIDPHSEVNRSNPNWPLFESALCTAWFPRYCSWWPPLLC